MIYSKSFHAKRIKDPKYNIMAAACVDVYRAVENRMPASVTDIGCSCGVLLEKLRKITGAAVVGVDYSLEKEDTIFRGTYHKLDLGLSEPNGFKALAGDLTVCQEVLEHISPHRASNALHCLANACKNVLIFSAARPGQPGRHHVNCKEPEYWRDALAAMGFEYSSDLTALYLESLLNGGVTKGCYFKNTQCFIKV